MMSKDFKTALALWRRLVPAVLVAAAAVLGGSAVGDPPTACAEPKKPFNKAGYDACVEQVIQDNKDNKITDAQKTELLRGCCILAGGKMKEGTEICEPVAAEAPPGRLPPGVDIQTATPVPPPGPEAPPPTVIGPG